MTVPSIAPALPAPFIQVRDISVTYPNDTVALKPISTHLNDHDITVLLGPSGAGKSTLLRVLNHLVVPTSGEVIVLNTGALSSGAVLRQHRRQTGVIFQRHQLIGRLSAMHNVLIGRIGHYGGLRTLLPMPKVEQHWALECLERVELLDKALMRCDLLSGGQQQRVGIARALAQKPRLILADEPVASLDPASSERVMDLLRTICKQDQIPTVISLHQLDYARAYADRIIGLSSGEIVYDGAPDDLNDEPLQRIYGTPTVTESTAETPRFV